MLMGNLLGIMLAAVLTVMPSPISQEYMDSAIYYVRQEALNPFVPGGIYEDMQIIYAAGDKRVYLKAEDVVDWVRYWPDGHWDIDDDRIAEFVTGLQDEFDTWNYYKVLETTDGRVVRVPPGEYGWRLNRSEELKLISMMLRNNGSTSHQI